MSTPEQPEQPTLIQGPKFQLGRIVATRGVSDQMDSDSDFAAFVSASFARHAFGDWGNVCEEDQALNETALTHNTRLLSSYKFRNPDEIIDVIWIITEADRSVTTVLFPHEY